MSAAAANQPLDKTIVAQVAAETAPLAEPAGRPVAADKNDSATASQKLADKNVIPQLTLTETPPQPGDSANLAGALKQTEALMPQPAAHKDWTIALDLALTMPPNSESTVGAGVERELPQLEALAQETKGKSVNFVVHAERLVDADGNFCKQEDAAKTAACDRDAARRDDDKVMTQRFFIHDGKIDKLPDADYIDGDGDAEELVKEAVKFAPSTNIALMVHAHGMGADGVDTNIGPVSLDKEITAIKNGLAGSGHEKLDLLDFNACDMAESKVVDRASQVSKDLVASSGVEWSNASHDGQNMISQLKAVLSNTHLSGSELGEKIVEQARAGDNGVGDNTATPTLANFDLSHYGTFNTSLNQFGRALDALAQDDGNMKVLQGDIEKSAVPETGMLTMHLNNRDLKSFAENVLSDSQANKFSGDNKQVEEASRAVLQSMGPLVSDKFGQVSKGYDKLGGLTAYLPGSEMLDSDKVAHSLSPLRRASNDLSEALHTGHKLADKQEVIDKLNDDMYWLPAQTNREFTPQANMIKEAREALQNSNSDSSFAAAGHNLIEVLDQANNGPMGEKVVSDLLFEAKYRQQNEMAQSVENLGPDWDAFIRKVQASAK